MYGFRINRRPSTGPTTLADLTFNEPAWKTQPFRKGWRMRKTYQARKNKHSGGWSLWHQPSNRPIWVPDHFMPGGTFKTQKAAKSFLKNTTWDCYKEKLKELEAQKKVEVPDSAA